MNFFGHYYIDNKPQNPWYNMGLIYPDLFRDLFRTKAHHTISANTQISEFQSGINQHLALDKIFHNSEHFHQAEAVIKRHFDEIQITKYIPRAWFLAHILTELLIDQSIVKHSPEKAQAMYDDMETVLKDPENIALLFTQKDSRTIFLTRLQRINADKYIFAYANNQKLIRALWGVYHRAGINLNPENMDKANELLSDLIEKLNLNDELKRDYYLK